MSLTADEAHGNGCRYSYELDVLKYAVLGGGKQRTLERAQVIVDAGDARTLEEAVQSMPIHEMLKRITLGKLRK